LFIAKGGIEMKLTTTLFSFKGRMNRLPYWMVYITITILVVIIVSIFATLLPEKTAEGQFTQQLNPMQLLAIICIFVIDILYLWSLIAISVKRLHDRDQSGWWFLVGLIPLIGQLWYFIVVMCLSGTSGDNRFGPDPREENA